MTPTLEPRNFLRPLVMQYEITYYRFTAPAPFGQFDREEKVIIDAANAEDAIAIFNANKHTQIRLEFRSIKWLPIQVRKFDFELPDISRDSDFLEWVADRLENHFKVDGRVDYLIRLRRIAQNIRDVLGSKQ